MAARRKSGLVLASLTLPAHAEGGSAASPLRTADLVRPKASRLAGDDDAGGLKQAAYRPPAPVSLLPADVFSIARTERSHRKPDKADR